MTMDSPTMITKNPVKLRHELKQLINPQDDLILSSRLRKLFPHDKHSCSRGTYRVSSLYFDTPDDKALRQKLDGVNLREKFRIRYYRTDTSFIRLEKKWKINGLCGKSSARITSTQVQDLLEGNYRFLLVSNDPLQIEFYSKIKGQLLCPKTIVVYEREAFSYLPGNVRITIDRDLRSSMGKHDFLNPDAYRIPVSDSFSVLEIKYDEYLPDIVRMAVQCENRRTTAFSKYMVCRRYD